MCTCALLDVILYKPAGYLSETLYEQPSQIQPYINNKSHHSEHLTVNETPPALFPFFVSLSLSLSFSLYFLCASTVQYFFSYYAPALISFLVKRP